jgi:hypothetical protein
MKNKKMKNKNFSTNTKTIMNKSLNLNTLKNNYFKNTLKLGMTAIFIMALGTANAQTTTGDGASVRVIDNKGTIKYLQTNNGITSITSTDTGNKTTTTWQLGGTLASNTDIDLAGNTFSLDQVIEIDGTSASAENIAATTTALVAGTTTGYTIIVRDEATGALKKMLASDLIEVGITELTSIDLETAATTVFTGVAGLPANLPISKVSLYRNGTKLRAGTDYTVTDANEINIITEAGDAGLQDFNLFATDILEVHWIK